MREPYGLFHHKFCLTTAAASNEVAVVKPIIWPRAVAPAGGFELPVVTTDAVVRAAEFWAMSRKSLIPKSSPDALDADNILAGRAPPIGQPGVTVIVASAILDQLTRFPVIDAETCSPRFGSIRPSRLLGQNWA